MFPPDAISPLSRYAALVAEIPVIQLAEPVARELGLREGEFVQGTFEARGDAMMLSLNGRFLALPPGWWQRVAIGDLRWFRVHRQLDGLSLRASGPPGPSPVSGNVALESLSEPLSPEPAVSARHLGLLARPSGFQALESVLVPGRLESALLDEGATELAKALAASRLRVEALSAESVQQAVGRSGLWGEAVLALGRQFAFSDLKMLLRHIARVLGGKTSIDGKSLDDAVDDIEHSQLEAVQAQSDQRQVFSMMLPFADAEPARLRFERNARRGESERDTYTIDLHIAPAVLGDLWLKTSVSGKQVQVTVWALRDEVAVLASAAGDELAVDLQDAGLILGAFHVQQGVRPDSPAEAASVGLVGLDVKA